MTPIGRVLERALAPIRARIRSLAQRAVLSSLADADGVQVVTVKLLGDHVRKAEHFQPGGLSSNPSAGTGVCLMVGANSDHAVLLGLANPDHRPTGMASGETALYSEHSTTVILDANGDVILGETYATKSAALALSIAQKVEAELEKLRTTINTHTHAYLPGPGASTPTATALPQAAAVASTASANVKGKA